MVINRPPRANWQRLSLSRRLSSSCARLIWPEVRAKRVGGGRVQANSHFAAALQVCLLRLLLRWNSSTTRQHIRRRSFLLFSGGADEPTAQNAAPPPPRQHATSAASPNCQLERSLRTLHRTKPADLIWPPGCSRSSLRMHFERPSWRCERRRRRLLSQQHELKSNQIRSDPIELIVVFGPLFSPPRRRAARNPIFSISLSFPFFRRLFT